jgi:hypothetical protein
MRITVIKDNNVINTPPTTKTFFENGDFENIAETEFITRNNEESANGYIKDRGGANWLSPLGRP